MKRGIMVLVASGIVALSLAADVLASDSAWQDIGRGILDVKSIVVDPDNPSIIYAGTSAGVLRTEDAGEQWRNILSTSGKNKGVNFLLFDPKDKNMLYAATQAGLFYSANAGKNWSRIFKGTNSLENECITLGVLPSGIYLGTKQGLFSSNDNGRSWHKEAGKIGNTPILAIAYSLRELEYIYVACMDGIFKTQDAGKSWERIFVAHPVENGDNGDEVSEGGDEPERFSDIRHLCIDSDNSNSLFLATGNGVYRSKDKGKSWESMAGAGLLNKDIRFLLSSTKSTLFAVSKSGVFEYENERWHELSSGFTSNDIRSLALDSEDNLYAACDKGLFKLSLRDRINGKQGTMVLPYGQDEPKIKQVQEAAIKYAEADSEKIRNWRNQAAKKAWLPQLSVGLDRDTTDLWHWEGGSTTKADDDTLMRGQDTIDWDITLSWDLGELIWNDDQTSIDVRSRLLVEMREDILDQVTKLYFERLRVKSELNNLSIEDRKKRFEKELRLEELTALLDGLTGDYFSQQLMKAGGA